MINRGENEYGDYYYCKILLRKLESSGGVESSGGARHEIFINVSLYKIYPPPETNWILSINIPFSTESGVVSSDLKKNLILMLISSLSNDIAGI